MNLKHYESKYECMIKYGVNMWVNGCMFMYVYVYMCVYVDVDIIITLT